jgi:arylsulfatase A-like enzyme
MSGSWRITLLAVSVFLLPALSGTPAVRGAEPRRPNIVFILSDDLGYGDLGCYGQKRIQTPNIDRMAREGMRFTQMYAGSTVCAPSRCVLMTGLHTGHCFIRGNARVDLRPSDVTVAEVLKTAGYTNGLVGKWGLGTEGGVGVPTRQGFDYFYGFLDQRHAHNYYPHFLMRNEKRVILKNEVPGAGPFGSGVATRKVEYAHDLFAKEALDFISQNKERPFFLYLALTIPHANNEARNKGMEVPDLGIYKDKDWPAPQKGHAAMITRMDTDIGRLFTLLKTLGLDEKTIVFFSSDNGPHREGGNNPDFNNSRGPLKGIKRDLTEGGIRMPFIARWPGKVPAGTTADFIGSFQDMMPTLAELAGVSDKVPSGLDGISFVPTLLGHPEKQKKHEILFWAFYERGGARALRMGNWKAVQQPIKTPVRLYDLEKDIGETRNVAKENPEVVEKMTKIMDREYTPSEKWKFPLK